jgi:hypothetical protein
MLQHVYTSLFYVFILRHFSFDFGILYIFHMVVTDIASVEGSIVQPLTDDY